MFTRIEKLFDVGLLATAWVLVLGSADRVVAILLCS